MTLDRMPHPKVAFSLSATLLSVLLLPSAAIASAALLETAQANTAPTNTAPTNTAPTNTVETSTLQFNPPALPDRHRPDGRSRGGASRGNCAVNDGQVPLTALVPATQESPENAPAYEAVFSLTSESRPTFWFYVPYDLSTTPLEFVLQDDNNNTISTLNLSQIAAEETAENASDTGIIQVTLPETTPELQQDTLYHWYFLAYCDAEDPVFVEGWIQSAPQTPELASALTEAAPKEQAELYANNSFWQDAITTLGNLYRMSASDPTLISDWNSLLSSVNLETVTEQPLVDCCTVEVSNP